LRSPAPSSNNLGAGPCFNTFGACGKPLRRFSLKESLLLVLHVLLWGCIALGVCHWGCLLHEHLLLLWRCIGHGSHRSCHHRWSSDLLVHRLWRCIGHHWSSNLLVDLLWRCIGSSHWSCHHHWSSDLVGHWSCIGCSSWCGDHGVGRHELSWGCKRHQCGQQWSDLLCCCWCWCWCCCC